MHQTKQGNPWYFGMKAHIGADRDSTLVHTVVVTAAKASGRAFVEHSSSIVKNLFPHRKVRHRGLAKVVIGARRATAQKAVQLPHQPGHAPPTQTARRQAPSPAVHFPVSTN